MKLRWIALGIALCCTFTAQAQQTANGANAKLDRLYQNIEARLAHDQAVQKKFAAAQRAWTTYRDSECRFAASGVYGGSAYPQVLAACTQQLTERRIKDLRYFLYCAQGDLTCPVPNP